jgi:hypothetical protein
MNILKKCFSFPPAETLLTGHGVITFFFINNAVFDHILEEKKRQKISEKKIKCPKKRMLWASYIYLT